MTNLRIALSTISFLVAATASAKIPQDHVDDLEVRVKNSFNALSKGTKVGETVSKECNEGLSAALCTFKFKYIDSNTGHQIPGFLVVIKTDLSWYAELGMTSPINFEISSEKIK